MRTMMSKVFRYISFIAGVFILVFYCFFFPEYTLVPFAIVTILVLVYCIFTHPWHSYIIERKRAKWMKNLLSHVFNVKRIGATSFTDDTLSTTFHYEHEQNALGFTFSTHLDPYSQDMHGVFEERLNRFQTIIGADPSASEYCYLNKRGVCWYQFSIPKNSVTEELLSALHETICHIHQDDAALNKTIYYATQIENKLLFVEEIDDYPHRLVGCSPTSETCPADCCYTACPNVSFDEYDWPVWIIDFCFDEYEMEVNCNHDIEIISPETFEQKWKQTVSE